MYRFFFMAITFLPLARLFFSGATFILLARLFFSVLTFFPLALFCRPLPDLLWAQSTKKCG